MQKRGWLLLLGLFMLDLSLAQEESTLDQIIAQVNDEIILESELGKLYSQLQADGQIASDDDPQTIRCELLEFLLTNKVLLAKARMDSIKIPEEVIEAELRERLRLAPSNIPEVRLQEILRELRPVVEEQLLVAKIERILTQSVEVTPQEVRYYFSDTPPDEMPEVGVRVEVAQLVVLPSENQAFRRQYGLDADPSLAQAFLDSLRQEMIAGEISFEEAARAFSDDRRTAENNGFFYYNLGDNLLPVDALDSYVFFTVDTMEVEEISPSLPYRDDEGEAGFRLLYLKSKLPAHRASLENDFAYLRQIVLQAKREEFIQDWMRENASQLAISYDENFEDCTFWE